MDILNARYVLPTDALKFMVSTMDVKQDLSIKIARELAKTDYIQLREDEEPNETWYRAQLHVVTKDEYIELLRLRKLQDNIWIQDRERKADAFDEIYSDSKMDVYDFELGEYVLDVIKRYENKYN